MGIDRGVAVVIYLIYNIKNQRKALQNLIIRPASEIELAFGKPGTSPKWDNAQRPVQLRHWDG